MRVVTRSADEMLCATKAAKFVAAAEYVTGSGLDFVVPAVISNAIADK